MILITGAAGFVGSSLVVRLERESGASVVRAVRRAPDVSLRAGRWFEIGELTANLDWSQGLRGVTTVIHAAARVHLMVDEDPNPLAAFRRVNVAATLNLARQAAAAGVSRFVFLSTAKVLGESTQSQRPFSADSLPAPEGPYAVSKADAEHGLQLIAGQTGMEVAIVRPVLVYGPGVRANFRAMMQWLMRGIPLPFGGIYNRRSFIGVDNLVDLLATCARHARAGNQIFMASDGEDLSTPDLLRRMGAALGKPARLLPVPPSLLRVCGTVLGRREAVERLCSSMQVDIQKNLQVLGWRPPIGVDEGFVLTARSFLSEADH